MRIIKNILYLEFQEVAQIGVSVKYLRVARHRNSSSWTFIDDPEDRRKVLIEFDSMKDKYKDLVIEELCDGIDPYQFMASEIIRPHLISEEEDVEFIRNYMVGDFPLEDDKQEVCIKACQFLSLLKRFRVRDMKALGYKKSSDFYEAVIALIKKEKVQLPSTYNRLRIKAREYVKKGAKVVVPKGLGNQNGRKVTVDGAAFIKELMSKHNQYTNEQIALIYNAAAEEQGWKQISSKTIFNYRSELETNSLRKGVSTWRDSNDFVVGRMRPSRPNYLWVGDGTPYELYFKYTSTNKQGHNITHYSGRKVVYVVVDAFNDMVVGAAIGDTENAQLALKAWKNACNNTGVMPMEVKTDNFAAKALHPVYRRLAGKPEFFAPSAVGNARDKVIEAFFGRIYGQITRLHDNASGRNIRAKEQPNRDFLDKIKKNFPNEDEVTQQIMQDMMLWNSIPRKSKGGKSLEQEWIEADHSKDRPFTDFHRLDIFGEDHSHTNRLTNKGIEVTLGGVTRRYMKLDMDFYETIGMKYQVKYDSDNYSKVIVVGEDNRKHLLEELKAIPMAKMDMQEGDRTELNKMLNFKEKVINHFVIDKQEERRKTLEEAGLMDRISAEGIAKALFIEQGQQKGLNYKSQEVLKSFDEQVLDSIERKRTDKTSAPQPPIEEGDDMFFDPYG
jgi:hypothetical protein